MTGARLEAAVVPASVALGAGGRDKVEHAAPLIRSVADGAYDGELSLIHKSPDGKEDILRRNLRLGTSDSPFLFSQDVLSTLDGVVTASIKGTVRPMTTAAGALGFQFEVKEGFTTPAATQSVGSAAQSKAVLMPPGADTVTIDLPMPRSPVDSLAGHTLSLRLKVTPHR